MKIENLVVTIFAEDRAGIVQELSDVVLAHDGNWLESSLSRMSGQFAGIVNISVSTDKRGALQQALTHLEKSGIHVTSQNTFVPQANQAQREVVELVLEANDRPGIVEEISSALAESDVNVEQLETVCESASMAGYQLFIGHLMVALPEGFSTQQLESVLENVSDDVMVSIL